MGSSVIIANAWHHRSDALSSVVAIVGVGGALCGWRFLDPLCGVAVAGLVAWMGGQIIFDALLRLSDTADIEATICSRYISPTSPLYLPYLSPMSYA